MDTSFVGEPELSPTDLSDQDLLVSPKLGWGWIACIAAWMGSCPVQDVHSEACANMQDLLAAFQKDVEACPDQERGTVVLSRELLSELKKKGFNPHTADTLRIYPGWLSKFV